MPKEKIVEPEYVRLLSEELHRNHSVIVFTNGIFDLLHPGHIHYLSEARKLGTDLIVGLNSDASASRIKGERRPLNPLAARAEIVAALEAVSFVTWFEDDTPAELIGRVRPDILVKGGDWEVEKIVGKNLVESYGGKVLAIPYLSGYSTTALIEKILKTT
jgi:rfaE bifunctional protein nucleotidyltransferase chain/domain